MLLKKFAFLTEQMFTKALAPNTHKEMFGEHQFLIKSDLGPKITSLFIMEASSQLLEFEMAQGVPF